MRVQMCPWCPSHTLFPVRAVITCFITANLDLGKAEVLHYISAKIGINPFLSTELYFSALITNDPPLLQCEASFPPLALL